ncbi:hypothetical protein GOC13_07365 [Sinorhizobium meliloti]|nr:hypothetical protein [Sinorhizobium meliloti]
MDEFDAQELINSGLAWRLEGSIGRQCMAAIESGACMLGRDGHRDYWGNYVPSRDEVKAGTKGSFDYVADRFGADHAETQAAKD